MCNSPADPPLSPSPNAGVTAHATAPAFHVGAWDPKADLCTCGTSPLLMEPFSLPNFKPLRSCHLQSSGPCKRSKVDHRTGNMDVSHSTPRSYTGKSQKGEWNGLPGVSQGSRPGKNSGLPSSSSVLPPFYGFVSESCSALKSKSNLYSTVYAKTQVKARGHAMEYGRNFGGGGTSWRPHISCKTTSKGSPHSCGLIRGHWRDDG